VYLEAKFAGPISYGLSSKLLSMVCPSAVPRTYGCAPRRRAGGPRLEDELDPEQPGFVEGWPAERDELPRPELPLTVRLAGGYVHPDHQRSRRDG
jgi:hypothetical protein